MKAKLEELKVLRSKKAEMDARVASLEKELAAAVTKRGDLEAEVMSKKMEFDLVKAKEVAAKAFDAEKTEILKELEGLKRKVEEIQLTKSVKNSETRTTIVLGNSVNLTQPDKVHSGRLSRQ